MPPIVRGKINAVRFVVRGDDDAGAIEDAIFAQVLFIDAQYVWR
jgi:hypothetical protein